MNNNIDVFIISLKIDTERRKLISEQLDSLQIDYKFIDAVLGSELNEDDLKNLNQNSHFHPTPAEIGCSLSHQSVYMRMLSERKEWAIILEDDVIITPQFKSFIDNFTVQKREHISKNSIYILGGQEGLSSRRKISCSFFNRYHFGDVTLKRVTYSPKYIFRTCCYLINIRTAQNLINEYNRDYFIADHWDYLYKKKCFDSIFFTEIISHPLVTALNSNIEAERHNKTKNKKNHRKKSNMEKKILNALFLIKKTLRQFKY